MDNFGLKIGKFGQWTLCKCDTVQALHTSEAFGHVTDPIFSSLIRISHQDGFIHLDMNTTCLDKVQNLRVDDGDQVFNQVTFLVFPIELIFNAIQDGHRTRQSVLDPLSCQLFGIWMALALQPLLD